MPDTLHEVARRMAAAGRLPGLAEGARGRMCRPDESTPDWWAVASEGDLMCAAIQHADSKEWTVRIGLGAVVVIYLRQDNTLFKAGERGTTAMSVLLAVEKACDAAEANGGGR